VTFAPSRSDGSKLVSQGKPASQISTGWGGDSTRAVDGNTDGNFGGNSVTCTQLEDQPWWRVNLLGFYEVSEVVVWNRADCCGDRLNNFDVLVGSHKCGSVRGAALTNPVKCDKLLKGSSVTVQLQGRNYLSLAEVEVYGKLLDIPKRAREPPPDGYQLLTGLHRTKQSSVAWGGASARAVDGNTAGNFGSGSCTHTNFEKAWWAVDLGDTYQIEKVVLWNREDCCSERLNNVRPRASCFLPL
jgi:hypothetical protein